MYNFPITGADVADYGGLPAPEPIPEPIGTQVGPSIEQAAKRLHSAKDLAIPALVGVLAGSSLGFWKGSLALAAAYLVLSK